MPKSAQKPFHGDNTGQGVISDRVNKTCAVPYSTMACEPYQSKVRCLTVPKPGGAKSPRWLWTLITFSVINQTMTNVATLSKIYMTIIW